MAGFERASPAIKDMLMSLYRADKPKPVDQRLYEFGTVEYHVQSAGTDRDRDIHLSISLPILSRGISLERGTLWHDVVKIIEGIYSDAIKIAASPEEGYQITLKLDLDRILRGKDSMKIIEEISSIPAAILSHGIKDVLRTFNYHEIIVPIKLEYHPKEPFFVVRQPEKIAAVFPMRFKEDTDIILAIALFQGLTNLSSSEKWSRAPACSWSPIPPPELMGESLEDLSTNGGFVSFEISSRHLKGERLEKTVWNLLHFHASVKYYIKDTCGFLHRRMRNRLNNLVKVLHATDEEEDEDDVIEDPRGCGCMGNLVRIQRRTSKRGGGGGKSLRTRMKGISGRVKINGFKLFRRRWLRLPRLSSSFLKYRKVALPLQ